MSKESEDKIDAGTPALYVLCGATRKRWRPLQGDVVMLGRSSGCDIGLVSPEVSPVHCVIVRTLGGWRIRDCSGRATRINGKAIQDEPLRNGDVLQIGTFSFEAKLPAVAGHHVAAPPRPAPRRAPVVTDDAEREKLLRSRRHLVDLALGLRRRLREHEGDRQANEQERKVLEQQRSDLEQIERRLRQAHKEPLTRNETAADLERMAADKERAAAEKLARAEARQAELDSYANHLRRQADRAHADQLAYARRAEAEHAEVEAELIQQRVAQIKEQRALDTWQQHLAARQAEMEAMAEQLTDVFQQERDQFEAERSRMALDRELFEAERVEAARLRAELEQLRAQGREASAGRRETVAEGGSSDRLASARKILQDLQQRRKHTVYKPPSHPVLTPPSHQG